ncbi:MAG TPA: hypothetical protein VG270_01380, partial [Pseudolabrys sp.]|nr:hypothetical protein [Pseudolabrys sp.]
MVADLQCTVARRSTLLRPGHTPLSSAGPFVLGLVVMSVTIRPATPADIPHITRIYAPAVLAGSSSFELEAPDEMEMARRMKTVLEGGYPYLAAEIGSRFAGYAYASV